MRTWDEYGVGVGLVAIAAQSGFLEAGELVLEAVLFHGDELFLGRAKKRINGLGFLCRWYLNKLLTACFLHP